MTTFGDPSKEENEIMFRAETREIVRVVLDHGLSQQQIYYMIYLLALEIENADHLKDITSLVSNSMDNKTTKKSSIITEGVKNE